VYNGGKILAAIPHLNVNNVRDENYTLINKGDFSDLFGCIVKGSGKNLNWGVKFIKESIIPGCLYPYTSDGLCDPICADGTIKSADVTITGGQVTALLSDRFIKWKENSPPVVIENSYGKGFATLIASWDYPGAESMQKLYKIILKAILSGEQKKADIKVLCNDKIYYSVYSDTFASTVYLLNSDYNNSNKCNINYGEMTMEMEIPSCSMNIAYITPHFLCSPVENGLAINEIKETKNRIEIKVNGSGVQYMKWVLPKVQPNILVNGEPVTFDVSNGCYMSKHELLI